MMESHMKKIQMLVDLINDLDVKEAILKAEGNELTEVSVITRLLAKIISEFSEANGMNVTHGQLMFSVNCAVPKIIWALEQGEKLYFNEKEKNLHIGYKHPSRIEFNTIFQLHKAGARVQGIEGIEILANGYGYAHGLGMLTKVLFVLNKNGNVSGETLVNRGEFRIEFDKNGLYNKHYISRNLTEEDLSPFGINYKIKAENTLICDNNSAEYQASSKIVFGSEKVEVKTEKGYFTEVKCRCIPVIPFVTINGGGIQLRDEDLRAVFPEQYTVAEEIIRNTRKPSGRK